MINLIKRIEIKESEQIYAVYDWEDILFFTECNNDNKTEKLMNNRPLKLFDLYTNTKHKESTIKMLKFEDLNYVLNQVQLKEFFKSLCST